MQQQETGKAGYIFMALLIAAFCVLIIVFAFQTYLLVNTLFPNDNVFMKWVTVFSFDGCCVIYAGLELFYPFKWRKAKTLVGIMWGATFFGSLLCTIAYMNLSSDHLLHQIVDSTVLIACYAVVTLVFSGDIVAITYLIKGEYTAHMAWKYRPRPLPVTPEPPTRQPVQYAHNAEIDAAIANDELLDTRGMNLPPLSRPSSTPVPLANPGKYLDLLDKAERYGQISKEDAQPLRDMIRGSATRPLPTAPTNGAKSKE